MLRRNIRDMYEMLCEYAEEEKRKLKPLGAKARREYIWEYHKWQIISAALIVLILTLGIIQACTYKATVYELAIVNCGTDFERDRAVEKSLAEFFGINPKRERVVAESAYSIAYGESMSGSANYADYDKLFLKLGNGEIDAVIAPRSFVKYCTEIEEGVFYSPSELGLGAEISEINIETSVAAAEETLICFVRNGANTERSKQLARALAERLTEVK